jgi:hypothetical protein
MQPGTVTNLLFVVVLLCLFLLSSTLGYRTGRERGRHEGAVIGFEAGYRKGACVTVHRFVENLRGIPVATPMQPCTAEEWSEPEQAREQ